jgi:hypothetical protein
MHVMREHLVGKKALGAGSRLGAEHGRGTRGQKSTLERLGPLISARGIQEIPFSSADNAVGYSRRYRQSDALKLGLGVWQAVTYATGKCHQGDE